MRNIGCLLYIMILICSSCKGESKSDKDKFQDIIMKQDTLNFVESVKVVDTLNTYKVTFKFNYMYPSHFWGYYFWNYLNYELTRRVNIDKIEKTFYLSYSYKGYTPGLHEVELANVSLHDSEVKLYKLIVTEYVTSEFNYLDFIYCKVVKCHDKSSKLRDSDFLGFVKQLLSVSSLNEDQKNILNKMKKKLLLNDKKHLVKFIEFIQKIVPLK